ncbi:triose-phosphate isomerase [Leifsonia poae]|uniref:triose-phosphate isomerase n=1 Tax=Leifsonia poae TaxID=110933 RepID=UPI001CBB000A|nr:triose-phosphate isomerase [Leifsonia poae]
MTEPLRAPFFEIGPKNLLRRRELEELARAAGAAARQYGVDVVLTVPNAMVAPIAELDTGIRVFAQSMDCDPLGPSFGRITAEALLDAGAVGVMLNHDAAPLDAETLAATVVRARDAGLLTIVCAGTEREALSHTALRPTAVLFEPPALIGTSGPGERDWIRPITAAMRRIDDGVLAMHAGGVSSALVARDIMAAGADGTGSTSGVLSAENPLSAAGEFIAGARAGWDDAHTTTDL